ncbi:MAG: lytic transglycosylase [Candidatus Limnocylindria bacterium]
MHRPQLFAPLAGLAALILAAPILGAVALAADPIVVKGGDTLTAISKRHGVSIDEIVELNGLLDANRIYIGQRLRLTAPTPATGAAPPAAATPAVPSARIHTIGAGEHLTGIALRYGVTVSAIAAANGIGNPSRIYAGQALTIPGVPAPKAAVPAPPARTAPPAPAARIHAIATGENLIGIARRYGVTVSAIAAANGIVNPSRIFAGQRLTIPGVTEGPAAAPAPAMPASMARLVAARGSVRDLIAAEAKRQGVPVAFALAVAWQESGWRQNVVSHAGAIGVMQLMPATAAWIGDVMLAAPVNPRDLHQNVRAGVRLLAHYLDRYDGNRGLVLAAYYQGQRATDRHGIYAVSRPYIASIVVLERLFGG